MKTKVGINGFGRIGRLVLKAILERADDKLDVVAINDLVEVKQNAHLLKYDSTYGIFPGEVKVNEDNNLVIDGKVVQVFGEKDPGNIPWGKLGVDIVIECTGVFTNAKSDLETGKIGADAHIIRGGAKKVVISAPAKGEDATIVMGVNEGVYDNEKHNVVSNASCTTNCLAPAAKVVNDKFKIKNGMMTTIHAYTNDQVILDTGHKKDIRRSRAAGLNIIPTTTGAAKAVALVIPDLKGKFDGYSLRVPTPTVSIVDFVAEVEKPTTAEELNELFKQAAEGHLKGILQYETEPLVSMDHKGSTYSSIIDAALTTVLDGTFVKVVTWYDNEWGYSCRTADLATLMGKYL